MRNLLTICPIANMLLLAGNKFLNYRTEETSSLFFLSGRLPPQRSRCHRRLRGSALFPIMPGKQTRQKGRQISFVNRYKTGLLVTRSLNTTLCRPKEE